VIVKLMADGLESRIKLFIDGIPFGIFGRKLWVWPVGFPGPVDALERLLLIPV
jgi:hypothetical protein